MVKVKICGITDLRDGLKAYEMGADFAGFVFFENSPRKIESEHARVIIEDMPKDIQKVGLFLDQDLQEVRDTAKKCHLDFVQLHGSESPDYCRGLSGDVRIIKAFKVKDVSSIENADDYENVYYYLFDTFVKGVPGGTGLSFDWNILAGKQFKKPFFLAGGLNPQNVADAIHKVSPFAVDVASGVEKSPGKKDYRRLKEFMDNAKKA